MWVLKFNKIGKGSTLFKFEGQGQGKKEWTDHIVKMEEEKAHCKA